MHSCEINVEENFNENKHLGIELEGEIKEITRTP